MIGNTEVKLSMQCFDTYLYAELVGKFKKYSASLKFIIFIHITKFK